MSIKLLGMTCGVVLMLGFYSSEIYGDNMNDEVEAAESIHAMAPLLGFDHAKLPVLVEDENTSTQQLSSIPMEEQIQDRFDNQLMTFLLPDWEFNDLRDGYATLQLARKIGFTPNEAGAPASQEPSWWMKIEEFLKKIEPSYEKQGFWNGQILY